MSSLGASVTFPVFCSCRCQVAQVLDTQIWNVSIITDILTAPIYKDHSFLRQLKMFFKEAEEKKRLLKVRFAACRPKGEDEGDEGASFPGAQNRGWAAMGSASLSWLPSWSWMATGLHSISSQCHHLQKLMLVFPVCLFLRAMECFPGFFWWPPFTPHGQDRVKCLSLK